MPCHHPWSNLHLSAARVVQRLPVANALPPPAGSNLHLLAARYCLAGCQLQMPCHHLRSNLHLLAARVVQRVACCKCLATTREVIFTCWLLAFFSGLPVANALPPSAEYVIFTCWLLAFDQGGGVACDTCLAAIRGVIFTCWLLAIV
jgi:hypothetical protein